MSFFQSLFGGSSSGSQQTSASGYGALPSFAQDAYKNLVSQATGMFDNGAGASMFTPKPQTAAETTAYGLSNPMSQQDVADMTSKYMNPFANYALTPVINQFNDANSIYNSALADSGQMNSNREFLNKGYMQGQEGQAIGSTLSNFFNTALNTGLTQKQLDIGNLLTEGSNQRNLGLQTAQAPASALQEFGQLLGFFPQTSTAQGSSNSSSTPGILSAFGGNGGAGNFLSALGKIF